MQSLGERVEVVDAVRGFALLGVLIANVGVFTHNIGDINSYAVSFYEIFVLNNFYVIFSMLFGLSFYIFMAKPKNSKVTFLRRVTILLFFGFIHLTFFWHIDILHAYAITAYLLIFFYDMDLKSIKFWIVGLFFVDMFFEAYLSSEILTNYLLQPTSSSLIDTYYTATYAENLSITFENLSNVLANTVVEVPHYLFLFLIGLYIGKSGIYAKTSERFDDIYRTSIYSLIVVLLSSLSWGVLAINETTDEYLVDPATNIFNLALGIFYVTFIVILYQQYSQSYIFDRFRAVGKMTLTNYLSHSVIYLILFYDFNLGLHNEFPKLLVPLIALPIFFLQAEFSRYWIEKHGHGPMEKIWRYLTYLRRKA
ncbi:DUF418 domain-containing protein [Natranaerofaba carboxydovora]|uniref:DUF418 domain-containing protein n=1 Tax=Natranaerofaba carboxydovora TaxID=2742683 RepID=UPI001F13AF1A|nr:DUF418 domain-containing protein [Natranaerofaba carboxydovora]UMZ74768.1 hypothetical protein ACONDI_02371 [Natranaerofaba carboxydovora]